MARFPFSEATTIPCPDCGKTENRDYSIFLDWLVDADNMRSLLTWVKRTPCYACQHKRHEEEKRAHQGGRPKRTNKAMK